MRPAALYPENGSESRIGLDPRVSRAGVRSPDNALRSAPPRRDRAERSEHWRFQRDVGRIASGERRVNQRLAGLVRRAIWRPQRGSTQTKPGVRMSLDFLALSSQQLP